MSTYKIKGIVILAVCSDGVHREVSLSPAAGITLRKTVLHVSHGQLKVYGSPVAIVPAGENRLVRGLKNIFRRGADKEDAG